MNTTTAAKVSNYNLTASNGRHIRVATRITFANGETVEFTERMTKRAAIAQAEREIARRA